jgi:hypothetical protein
MDPQSNETELLEEFRLLLEKAGIPLSSDRIRSAVTEFSDMKKHIAIVNRACTSGSEPSNVFVMPSIEMPK